MSDNDLLERIEKIERFLSNLGPLVNVAERLAQCERLLMFQGMDIEKNSANVEALTEVQKLQGAVNARMRGHISSINERLAQCEAVLMQQGLDIEKNSANIETCLKNLTVLNEITQPPADNATLSERLTQCEAVLMQHGLDIEKNSANVDALIEVQKLQGAVNARLRGHISSINERLAGGVSAREDATVALYGGEQ